jgi:two-component system response regulator YesN
MLLCDNEKWIREGIRTMTDWSAMSIDTIFTARDGVQAISIVKEQKPDIVITDIKMPNIDGLEMIDAIKNFINPKFIIVISGFSSFSYAQTALKLGVADYILKPINEDVLLASVQKCLALKREEDQTNNNLAFATVDRLNLWFNRISIIPPSKDDFLTVFGIDIENFPFVQVVVCKQKYSENTNVEIQKNTNSVKVISLDSTSGIYLLLQSHESRLLGLFFSEYQNTVSLSLKEVFLGNTQETEQNFYFGVGNVVPFTDGWQSYQQAEAVLKYALLFPKQYEYFYDYMFKRKEKPLDSFAEFNLSKPIALLVNHHFARYITWINNIFELINTNNNLINPIEIKDFFAKLVSSISQIWKINKDEFRELHDKIERMWHQEELYKELIIFPVKLHLDKDVGINQGLSMALEYIERNYSEQITMSQTALAIGLNPSYFSKMFSECAGVSFHKFLTKRRMERAKQMLRESNEKIYEIAEKVGYLDYRVFSSNFKHYCGVSPADYRNHIV